MNEQKAGWVWIPSDKGRWRPFTEFRQIQKGRNKGKVEVTLPATPARRVLVEPGAIRSYPVQTVNPKGEEQAPGFFEVKEEGTHD